VSLRRTAHALAALALALGVGTGCGEDTVDGPPPGAPATLRLTSDAFGDGEAIPRRYTCDGDEVSPSLRWAGVPAGTRALALVVEDPDAPGGTFVHWALLDVPPETRGLESGQVPAGAREGVNSFGGHGYRGPCPPEGDEPHRYVFLLYALKSRLGLDPNSSPAEARSAIGREALARGELTGRFGR
jgi:Raf kinase inhibitor-like YbhB/YbcL family protein